MSSLIRLLLVVGLASAAACASAGIPGTANPARPPQPPAINDPAFVYDGLKSYYLIANALTPGQNTLTMTLRAVSDTLAAREIHAWIDRAATGRVARGSDGTVTLNADLSQLGPGPHELLLAEAGSATAFARFTFARTHPLYVVVSSDWDDPDNSDASLALQEQLRVKHPDLVVTHLVGPYTFTDPSLDEKRKTFLATWVAKMRDTFGDEIGVHLHPWCHFVESAGVRCRTAPSTVYPAGDPSGYSVIVESYAEREITQMLQTAKQVFSARGFGVPTSFRAGGWTLGLETLRALAATGFTVDSSAVSWARLAPEWEDHDLYRWNRSQWTTIGDTSQPWYPSSRSLHAATPPRVPVLEVPDNGILVDYITAGDMIEVFTKNWSNRPAALTEPRQLSIGYHPTTLGALDFEARLDGALSHIDRYQAKNGTGPVVDARLSDLTKVWP